MSGGNDSQVASPGELLGVKRGGGGSWQTLGAAGVLRALGGPWIPNQFTVRDAENSCCLSF
jgi:hypothetical protein